MLTITIGVCTCGRRGTLIDGACAFCVEPAKAAPLLVPTPPLPVNRAIALLIEELSEDCPHPLTASLTLATVCADLCRLAGEPVPDAVLAALDGPDHAPIRRLTPTTRRGSYRDWEAEFCEEPA